MDRHPDIFIKQWMVARVYKIFHIIIITTITLTVISWPLLVFSWFVPIAASIGSYWHCLPLANHLHFLCTSSEPVTLLLSLISPVPASSPYPRLHAPSVHPSRPFPPYLPTPSTVAAAPPLSLLFHSRLHNTPKAAISCNIAILNLTHICSNCERRFFLVLPHSACNFWNISF